MCAPARCFLWPSTLCLWLWLWLWLSPGYTLTCTQPHCAEPDRRVNVEPIVQEKAFCRPQGADYEALCYVPHLCREKRENTWQIPYSTLEDLEQAGTANILEELWWYGDATILSPGDQRSLEDGNTTGVPGTTFVSTVQFGASIYARYTGFPLLSLLESQARGFAAFPGTMQPISTVLHVLFSAEQHRTEPWVRDLLSLIMGKYNLNILNGYSSLFINTERPRVCINALLYSHKNTGVLGERLRWFPGVWASDHLRSLVYPILPAQKGHTRSMQRAVILERRENLQGEPALRLLRQEDIEKISKLLTGMGFEVELAHFEHQTFKEQARIMNEADVVVTPHGNGLINTVFMQRCSIVVEIFPYNFASPVFADLAKQTGLIYREIFNQNAQDEITVPACLSNSSAWLSATREQCTRMLHTCLPCARSAPKVYPNIEQVRQALIGAMTEKLTCTAGSEIKV